MSVKFNDTARYSNLVKKELWPESGFCRNTLVANEAAVKTYAVGTVLGKVTATGKYKIAVETAVDGSKVAAAIVVDDYSIAAATDTKVLCLVKGPSMISKGALVLDATYDNDAKKDALYASLEAVGIAVLTTN